MQILFFCDMTQCHCVIFSRLFQTINLFRLFENRVSGDVTSHLKLTETIISLWENIQTFIFHAILKCVTFLPAQAVTILTSTPQLLGVKFG